MPGEAWRAAVLELDHRGAVTQETRDRQLSLRPRFPTISTRRRSRGCFGATRQTMSINHARRRKHEIAQIPPKKLHYRGSESPCRCPTSYDAGDLPPGATCRLPSRSPGSLRDWIGPKRVDGVDRPTVPDDDDLAVATTHPRPARDLRELRSRTRRNRTMIDVILVMRGDFCDRGMSGGIAGTFSITVGRTRSWGRASSGCAPKCCSANRSSSSWPTGGASATAADEASWRSDNDSERPRVDVSRGSGFRNFLDLLARLRVSSRNPKNSRNASRAGIGPKWNGSQREMRRSTSTQLRASREGRMNRPIPSQHDHSSFGPGSPRRTRLDANRRSEESGRFAASCDRPDLAAQYFDVRGPRLAAVADARRPPPRPRPSGPRNSMIFPRPKCGISTRSPSVERRDGLHFFVRPRFFAMTASPLTTQPPGRPHQSLSYTTALESAMRCQSQESCQSSMCVQQPVPE